MGNAVNAARFIRTTATIIQSMYTLLSTHTHRERAKDKFLCNSIISQPNSKVLKCRECSYRFFFYHSQGKLEVSSVTGRLEPKEAPAWQRIAFRYLVSFPIIGLCLALVFAVMFAMLQLQVHKKKRIKNEINFPLSTNQPQFTFIRLYHHLILLFTFTFPCSETLAKLFTRSDPTDRITDSIQTFIHSFIRKALKHSSHLHPSVKTCLPFCLCFSIQNTQAITSKLKADFNYSRDKSE